MRLDPATRARVRNLLDAARACTGGPTARATAIQLRRGAMRIARASRCTPATTEQKAAAGKSGTVGR